MAYKLNDDLVVNIAKETAMFASWLWEEHSFVLNSEQTKKIIEKILIRQNLDHNKNTLLIIDLAVMSMFENPIIKELRKKYFDFQVDAFMKSINVSLDSLKSSTKKKKTKPKKKSKNTNLKKDLDWFTNKGSFKKLERTKLVSYEEGHKPRQQFKSTRKFPNTGYWVFVEKHRSNNKWKAYIRIYKKKYWQDIESSGYCKEAQSAWDSLYKKLTKND